MSTTRAPYPSVRVDRETNRILDQLAELDGATKSAIVARAVEHYRYERMLERANEEWAAILADPAAAAARTEDALWDETVADGIGEREW